MKVLFVCGYYTFYLRVSREGFVMVSKGGGGSGKHFWSLCTIKQLKSSDIIFETSPFPCKILCFIHSLCNLLLQPGLISYYIEWKSLRGSMWYVTYLCLTLINCLVELSSHIHRSLHHEYYKVLRTKQISWQTYTRQTLQFIYVCLILYIQTKHTLYVILFSTLILNII